MSVVVERRDGLLFGVVIATALAGFALKAIRYTDRHVPAGTAIAEHVRTTMAAANWSLDKPVTVPESLPMTVLAFRKADCPHPVTVTVAEPHTGVDAFVRSTNPGADIVTPTSGPLVGRVVTLSAVSTPNASACRLPSATAWSQTTILKASN